MNTLPNSLPMPENIDNSPSSGPSMWVDEAIWGHRLHDEQLPWFIFLEFLTVFTYENDKGRAFDEQGKMNRLKYKANRRLYLRNILFNNPHFAEILHSNSGDSDRWREWLLKMNLSPTGINSPDFSFLKNRFHSFEDFCEVVSLVRSTSIEGNSNKRWTSKFVFPYGRDALYEDLDNNLSNDRRFFGRMGELLYLMLSRSSCRKDLLEALNDRLTNADKTWNTIIKCLQPENEEDLGGERANAFLPYTQHQCYDNLAEDWLALLRLEMPIYDLFPHLVNLAGLHVLIYQLTVSRHLLGENMLPSIVCEVVAPKKTLVREVSCSNYILNNLLPVQAVEKYISNMEASDDWQKSLREPDSFEKCKQIIREKVRWNKDDKAYDGPPDASELMVRFRQAAIKRHHQHVSGVHRNLGREIGLVSKRGTVKLRYAPTDELLKSLLFANTEKRSELHQFLARLSDRYGLVFGDKEAEKILFKGEFDKKAFQANSRRLEQRLGSLGLLRRLSDGCAYVINPLYAEAR